MADVAQEKKTRGRFIGQRSYIYQSLAVIRAFKVMSVRQTSFIILGEPKVPEDAISCDKYCLIIVPLKMNNKQTDKAMNIRSKN